MEKRNPFSLSGKTILVVGASSGIGRSIAVTASEFGAKIVACARNVDRLEQMRNELTGVNHSQLIGDITNEEDLKKIVDMVPPIDGLVLSAGKGLTLPFLYSTPNKYEDIFSVNFFSQVELLRLLVKTKKLKANASVVMVVSIGGVKKFNIGSSIYGASKAALNAIVHTSAIELASKGIRVNGICPGMVETPLINRGTLTEEQFKADMATYPLKRYGKPEDIAYGAIYLLSDASSWVTGHSLVIDGGVTAK